jgi:hypothetical protein
VRPLTAVETDVVRWFAQRLEEPQRHDLLADLARATAEEIRDEQLTIRFQIDGVTRPPYGVERPLPAAVVLDADGAKLDVTYPSTRTGALLSFR